jgi:hypothetical protein
MPASTTLGEFLTASDHELGDVYSSPGQTFTSLRRAAGHVREPADPSEQDGTKALARVLHIDDEERYARWSRFLEGGTIATDVVREKSY